MDSFCNTTVSIQRRWKLRHEFHYGTRYRTSSNTRRVVVTLVTTRFWQITKMSNKYHKMGLIWTWYCSKWGWFWKPFSKWVWLSSTMMYPYVIVQSRSSIQGLLLWFSLIVRYGPSPRYATISLWTGAYRRLWSLSTIRYDKPVSRSQRTYNDNSRYEKFLIDLNRSNSFFLK